jgi:cobalamin synthase
MLSAKRQTRSSFLLVTRFLFPLRDEPLSEPASAWAGTGRWLPVWGLAVGIVYAVVYRGAWKWFGEYQHLRLLPAVALLIFDFAWFGYRQLAAGVEVLGRRQPGAAVSGAEFRSVLAVMLIGLFKFSMLLALPAGAVIWPADWRQHLSVLYPSVIYRPLVLMPLYGRWAMMLALCIGRVSPGGSERLRQMAGGARLSAIIVWWFFIGLLTVAYCSPDWGHLQYGVVIALTVLVAAYLAGFTLARRYDGQTETTVAAAGLIGELSFLAFYLPVARAIYWY